MYDIEKPRIVNNYHNNFDIYQQLPGATSTRSGSGATVTAGATNPYDQASQIEAYLRTLTYDLKVPLVAADRDLVDAFLFDLRRGYCDYFASALW
ncbi:MAG: transglutaminase domain-containing protein [Anaerolineae bacterium]|uniref:transglutaminase domain-containing protein n=1 Tax=Candidatus Amarolinea dominans TaxID=3140696 RepID=UPI0031346E88|nr:transglutaminase domain-containing protein [Anaerolineae bacterium]